MQILRKNTKTLKINENAIASLQRRVGHKKDRRQKWIRHVKSYYRGKKTVAVPAATNKDVISSFDGSRLPLVDLDACCCTRQQLSPDLCGLSRLSTNDNALPRIFQQRGSDRHLLYNYNRCLLKIMPISRRHQHSHAPLNLQHTE